MEIELNNPKLSQPDIEKALLAKLILSGEMSLCDLQPEAFSIERYRWIYVALRNIYDRKAALDTEIILQELEKEGHPFTYSELINIHSADDGFFYNAEEVVPEYSAIIREAWTRRKHLQIATKIAQGAVNGGVDIAATIAALTSTSNLKQRAEPINNYLSLYWDEMSARHADPRDVWGIPTGYKKFDILTGGQHKNHVTLISGAPGTGKSALVETMVLQSCLMGFRWAFYSMEMDRHDFINRMIAQLVGLTEDCLSSGKFNDDFLPKIDEAMARISELPLYINDTPRMTTADIRADIAMLPELDGIALDYLNLLGDHGTDANETASLKSTRFRELCREFHLAGLSIQSMTKEGIGAATGGIVTGQNGKKGFASPQAALVGVSGTATVQHDADNIFMLVHDPEDTTGQTIGLLPAKMRHGHGSRSVLRFKWNAISPRLEETERINLP